jgi:hypothetical protein
LVEQTYGIDMKLAPGLTFSPECGVDSGNPNCHVTGVFVTRDDSAFYYQNIKDFCAPIKQFRNMSVTKPYRYNNKQ